MSSRIEARPTDGLSYNPNEAKYWDRAKLDKEIERVFDICHGCRLCFNLCPSFPALFSAVDAKGDDVRNLTAAENQRVIDLCWECRLCEVKCPYTPRDGHEFQLDFPALILRARAVDAREHGVKLRDKMLGNPDPRRQARHTCTQARELVMPQYGTASLDGAGDGDPSRQATAGIRRTDLREVGAQ